MIASFSSKPTMKLMRELGYFMHYLLNSIHGPTQVHERERETSKDYYKVSLIPTIKQFGYKKYLHTQL